jgi:superfamily II DNA or RNA helicase
MSDVPVRLGDKVLEAYQVRILEGVARAIEARRSGAVVAPTGAGKGVLAAGIVREAIRQRRPVLLIQPNVQLLRQNLAQIAGADLPQGVRISAWAAKDAAIETPEGKRLRNRDLTADVVLATAPALVRHRHKAASALAAFAARGALVVFDEGQGIAAEETAQLLRGLHAAGAQGIALTATPYRADGRDPLAPFAASVQQEPIGVASIGEVMASGRTVPPRFVLARQAFQAHIGAEAAAGLDQAFDDALDRHASLEQASRAAFSAFFGPEATPEGRALGRRIADGVARAWQTHGAARRLTLVHCDGLAFADAVAERIGQATYPDGHPRAGQAPRVAFVSADSARIQGAPPDSPRQTREAILSAARRGEIDVLVNCEALGVGTDIPAIDCNILAFQQRSPGPFVQIVGRGARAAPGKTDNLVVDLGRTVERLVQDLRHLAAGRPDEASAGVAALPEAGRTQLGDLLALDPSLAALPDMPARARRPAKPPGALEGAAPPPRDALAALHRGASPTPFRHGISIAFGIDGQTARAGLVVDLQQTGLWGGPCSVGAPRWLAVSLPADGADGPVLHLAAADPRVARGFLAWSGVRASAQDQADDLKPAKDAPKAPARTGDAFLDAPARDPDSVLARRNLARGEKILPALQAAVRLAVARELGQEKVPKILVVADAARLGTDRLRALRAYAQIARIQTIGRIGSQADQDALLRVFADIGIEPRCVLVKDPDKARKIVRMSRTGEIAIVAPTAKAAQEARATIEAHPERLVSRIANAAQAVA